MVGKVKRRRQRFAAAIVFVARGSCLDEHLQMSVRSCYREELQLLDDCEADGDDCREGLCESLRNLASF